MDKEPPKLTTEQIETCLAWMREHECPTEVIDGIEYYIFSPVTN